MKFLQSRLLTRNTTYFVCIEVQVKRQRTTLFLTINTSDYILSVSNKSSTGKYNRCSVDHRTRINKLFYSQEQATYIDGRNDSISVSIVKI